MSNTEFFKALRECINCFAWVSLHDHDGAYLQVVKENVKLYGFNLEGEHTWNAVLREDGDLYLN